MIFGSVCSGIEAASVAWDPLGWRAAFLAEIAAFPRAVLGHRFPHVPLRGDFTTIQAGDHDAIDVLVGGTPCQAFSVAGLRGGMADARGNLALEYLRLAQRLRPRWLVWENVPGVLSSTGGRDFGAFLGGLGELGYGFAYRVLDAQYFGLAQRRKRVFVVGYLGDWRRAAAVLFEPASLRGHPAPSRETGAGVAATLTRGAERRGDYGPAGHRVEDDINLVAGTLGSNSPGGGWRFGADEAAAGQLIADTVRSHPRPGSNSLGLLAYGGNNTSGPIEIATALNACKTASGRQDFETETFTASVAPALSASNYYGDHESREGLLVAGSAVAFQQSQSGMRIGELHVTLDANNGSRRHNGALTQHGVRRLTPRECERLQGFPDDWTLVPWRKGMAPDGPRYAALGNSMAVPCMRWIGARIAAEDASA